MSAYSSSGIIQLCRNLDMPHLLEKTGCTHLTCFGIQKINSQRISASLWHASYILLAKCLPTTQSRGAMMRHKFFSIINISCRLLSMLCLCIAAESSTSASRFFLQARKFHTSNRKWLNFHFGWIFPLKACLKGTF